MSERFNESDENIHRINHFFEVEGTEESERILIGMDDETLQDLKKDLQENMCASNQFLYNLVMLEICEREHNGEV